MTRGNTAAVLLCALAVLAAAVGPALASDDAEEMASDMAKIEDMAAVENTVGKQPEPAVADEAAGSKEEALESDEAGDGGDVVGVSGDAANAEVEKAEEADTLAKVDPAAKVEDDGAEADEYPELGDGDGFSDDGSGLDMDGDDFADQSCVAFGVMFYGCETGVATKCCAEDGDAADACFTQCRNAEYGAQTESEINGDIEAGTAPDADEEAEMASLFDPDYGQYNSVGDAMAKEYGCEADEKGASQQGRACAKACQNEEACTRKCLAGTCAPSAGADADADADAGAGAGTDADAATAAAAGTDADDEEATAAQEEAAVRDEEADLATGLSNGADAPKSTTDDDQAAKADGGADAAPLPQGGAGDDAAAEVVAAEASKANPMASADPAANEELERLAALGPPLPEDGVSSGATKEVEKANGGGPAGEDAGKAESESGDDAKATLDFSEY